LSPPPSLHPPHLPPLPTRRSSDLSALLSSVLSRSLTLTHDQAGQLLRRNQHLAGGRPPHRGDQLRRRAGLEDVPAGSGLHRRKRSEEHTSELQSRGHLVCRLLLEK